MIRKGIGAVVFLREKDKLKYLIFKRKKNWVGWEILKGGRKLFESEEKCLKRELMEEAGFSHYEAKRTRLLNEFNYSKELPKDGRIWSGAKHQIYIVEVFSKKVKIDKKEHSGFKWESYKGALQRLTWKDQKQIFKKAVKLIG